VSPVQLVHLMHFLAASRRYLTFFLGLAFFAATGVPAASRASRSALSRWNCPGESVRSRHCVAANQDWLFTRAWGFLEWETLHECEGAAIQPCR